MLEPAWPAARIVTDAVDPRWPCLPCVCVGGLGIPEPPRAARADVPAGEVLGVSGIPEVSNRSGSVSVRPAIFATMMRGSIVYVLFMVCCMLNVSSSLQSSTVSSVSLGRERLVTV